MNNKRDTCLKFLIFLRKGILGVLYTVLKSNERRGKDIPNK